MPTDTRKIEKMEDLKSILAIHGRESVICISLRNIMRIFPLIFKEEIESKSSDWNLMLLSIFRIISTTFSACTSPGQGAERSAEEAIFFSSRLRQSFEHHAYRSRLLVDFMNAARDAARAAASYDASEHALNSIKRTMSALRGRQLAQSAWNEIQKDIQNLSNPNFSKNLCTTRLWSTYNATLRMNFLEIQSKLINQHEDWEVWIDWYEARLSGNPIEQRLEIARATIDRNIWDRGPHFVNAHIKTLIANFAKDWHDRENTDAELAAQRPASYSFSAESGRIEAAPQREVPSNPDLAGAFHKEAVAKALQILAAHRQSNAPLRVEATIARLLEALGAAPDDIVPGIIVSRLRSLEADLKAYDTPEGQAELFPSAIAEMFDLQMTVDDLVALFPSVRDLQARRLVLDIQAADVPTVDALLAEIADAAAASDLVAASTVLALTDVDPEVARLSEVITSSANEDVRVAAVGARADIVAGKVLVSRNFLGAVVKLGKTAGDGARWASKQAGEIAVSSLKGAKKAIPRGVEKGVEKGVEGIVSGAIKGGFVALAGTLGGPLTALGALVTTFSPFRARIESQREEIESSLTSETASSDQDDGADT